VPNTLQQPWNLVDRDANTGFCEVNIDLVLRNPIRFEAAVRLAADARGNRFSAAAARRSSGRARIWRLIETAAPRLLQFLPVSGS
jgi:hypothetical protein